MNIALFTSFFLLISWISKRLPFLPLLCLLFGIGYGLLNPLPPHIENITKIALTFFLFIDSIRLHIPKIVHFQSLPILPFIITFLLVPPLAMLLFPLSLKEALFITIPLLALDTKILPPLNLPSRIRQAINIEGSFSSLLAIFLLAFFELSHPHHFFITIFFPILAGTALGYIIGLIATAASDYEWADPRILRGALLLIPFAVYGFCTLFHANPFIGVIAAGLTFGHTARPLCDTLFDLSRRQGPYLFYLLLIFLGALAPSLNIQPIHLLFALLLFPLRFVALLPTRYQWKTRAYLAFAAPRGLVPLAVLFLYNPSPLIATPLLLSLIIHSLLMRSLTHTYTEALLGTPRSPEYLPTIPFPA